MRGRYLLLAALIALPACGSGSGGDQTAKEVQTLLSWAATADMAAGAWAQGQVPEAYTQRTLESAAVGLAGEQDTVAQLPPVPGNTPLPERLRRVQAAVGALQQAVAGGHRGALAAPRARLAPEEAAFQRLLDELQGGQ